jgi:hypothetical protein
LRPCLHNLIKFFFSQFYWPSNDIIGPICRVLLRHTLSPSIPGDTGFYDALQVRVTLAVEPPCGIGMMTEGHAISCDLRHSELAPDDVIDEGVIGNGFAAYRKPPLSSERTRRPR